MKVDKTIQTIVEKLHVGRTFMLPKYQPKRG